MGRYFNLFCIVDGAIGLVFALGLLLLPTFTMQFFSVQLDPVAMFFVRATGTIFLGCSLIVLALRNAPPTKELATVLFCFGLADSLLGILFILAANSGLTNALGFGLGVLCLGPGVAFFLFSRMAVPSAAAYAAP